MEYKMAIINFLTKASSLSFDLQSKSMDWFLYDNGLRHERVKLFLVPSQNRPF